MTPVETHAKNLAWINGLRDELNEMNHGQYGRDGETCPAQRFLDDENAGEVDWNHCECPLAQVNQALLEKAGE